MTMMIDIQCSFFKSSSTYIHLISNKSVPTLQVLHTARESVNDNLLLALRLVVTNLLQQKVDGNLTRNNQTLLDVVINQLGILASAIHKSLA